MRALAVLCLLLWAPAAWADPQMQITGLDDFTLGAWSLGDPAINAHIDVCAYATLNLPISDAYAVTISSRTGSYALKSGVNSLPYTLSWDDGGAGNLGGSASSLTHNVKRTGQRHANILSALCALGITGPNARLNLQISQTDLTAAPYGTYSGTIDITISPN